MRVASALCAVLLLLLLVFIVENSQRADISDFGAHGHLPPGTALLLAAVLGMLLAVIEAPGRDPPFCGDIGCLPAKTLTVRIWVFCASASCGPDVPRMPLSGHPLA